MTNEDLKRFYKNNEAKPEDFVRLDTSGKIPAKILPSFVDDIVEGYLYDGEFYEDNTHTKKITPEKSKIYVDLSTNKSYRWGGTVYVLVGDGNTKYYQHNLQFTITETDAANLTFYLQIITSDLTEITDTTILDILSELYDTDSFAGTVSGSGDNTYAGPIGTFTASCDTVEETTVLKMVIPAYASSTFTINTIASAEFDTVTDTVKTL